KDDKPGDAQARMATRRAVIKMLQDEKAVTLLMGSEKMYGLLNISKLSREYQAAVVPESYLAREDYLLLWQLQAAGTVEMEVNIQGTLSGKPAEVYNTVAEIRGTEKPDEVVILGAHLDSWDLGTGAT